MWPRVNILGLIKMAWTDDNRAVRRKRFFRIRYDGISCNHASTMFIEIGFCFFRWHYWLSEEWHHCMNRFCLLSTHLVASIHPQVMENHPTIRMRRSSRLQTPYPSAATVAVKKGRSQHVWICSGLCGLPASFCRFYGFLEFLACVRGTHVDSLPAWQTPPL